MLKSLHILFCFVLEATFKFLLISFAYLVKPKPFAQFSMYDRSYSDDSVSVLVFLYGTRLLHSLLRFQVTSLSLWRQRFLSWFYQFFIFAFLKNKFIFLVF